MGGYHRAVEAARERLAGGVEVSVAGAWHLHPAFLRALAQRVTEALDRLPAEVRQTVPVILTAHSLPKAVVDREPQYLEQLQETVRAVAALAGLDGANGRVPGSELPTPQVGTRHLANLAALGASGASGSRGWPPRPGAPPPAVRQYPGAARRTQDRGAPPQPAAEGSGLRAQPGRWQFAYQSAGHTPEEWLKPDLKDLLPDLRAAGHRHVLVVPVQFLADHLEVLYDIDVAARAEAEAAGLAFHRIESLNCSPAFIDALADIARAQLGAAAPT
jgi:protoheme ferro-lyase